MIENNIKIVQLSIKQLKGVIDGFDGYKSMPKDTSIYKTKLAQYNNALKSLEYENKKLKGYQDQYPELFL